MMNLHTTGTGPPLLLVHGLGGAWQSWEPILAELAKRRTVHAVDLPGHGQSPAGMGADTFAGLADALAAEIAARGWRGMAMVGSSLGGRLVLEMARRGLAGDVVALDPGGFWMGWERPFFATTIGSSVKLLRALGAALPGLAKNPVSRSALLAQLSARPWALDGRVVADELARYAKTPTVMALIADLAQAPMQAGPAAPGTGRVTIGWGRHDRLCLSWQAHRAVAAFPGATLHWFEHSGHFPFWDEPAKAVRVILAGTG
jgi:pimeloyl-ACP methyl ester carboxylesterase